MNSIQHEIWQVKHLRGQIRNNAPKRRLDQAHYAIRLKHYSIRTEEAYLGWTTCFILLHDKRLAGDVGYAEIEACLTRAPAYPSGPTMLQKQQRNESPVQRAAVAASGACAVSGHLAHGAHRRNQTCLVKTYCVEQVGNPRSYFRCKPLSIPGVLSINLDQPSRSAFQMTSYSSFIASSRSTAPGSGN